MTVHRSDVQCTNSMPACNWTWSRCIRSVSRPRAFQAQCPSPSPSFPPAPGPSSVIIPCRVSSPTPGPRHVPPPYHARSQVSALTDLRLSLLLYGLKLRTPLSIVGKTPLRTSGFVSLRPPRLCLDASPHRPYTLLRLQRLRCPPVRPRSRSIYIACRLFLCSTAPSLTASGASSATRVRTSAPSAPRRRRAPKHLARLRCRPTPPSAQRRCSSARAPFFVVLDIAPHAIAAAPLPASSPRPRLRC
ncbi:hypothetical protein C8R45DRAFT_575487 [Mycena sanguinolenta]|nr:hypothetical protein C8R45DRAFT_575487 [Mycena sanguinolenta]